jgi:hypothetical protein
MLDGSSRREPYRRLEETTGMRGFSDVRRGKRCARCADGASVQVEVTGSTIPDLILDLCALHADLMRARAVPLAERLERGSTPRLR